MRIIIAKEKNQFYIKRVPHSLRNRKAFTMSQLIQLKQRIKVIETIKKTTNAMRLISMSMHSRLRQKKTHVDEYLQEITHLYRMVSSKSAAIQEAKGDRTLVIMIGSQKGLCGSFNTQLIHFFQHDMPIMSKKTDIIVIGKQIVDYFRLHHIPVLQKYPEFSSLNFTGIAQQLINFIEANRSYSSVMIYSNLPRTFFIQKSRKLAVYPVEEELAPHTVAPADYLWEQPMTDIIDTLERMYLKATIEKTLFESLFAEQAARFISMDNATRNAEDLLKTMKLDYNKLRQATITRELTDLASSTADGM